MIDKNQMNDWYHLSIYIDIKDIRINPGRPWNKDALSQNTGITIHDADTLVLPNATGDWSWYYLPENIGMAHSM